MHLINMTQVLKVSLNNDTKIPVIGLGTWQSDPGVIKKVIEDAVDTGYRHIDCAHIYGNQKEIGEAINNKISEGIVNRQDLFITGKLWDTFHRPGIVETALRSDLKDINLDYFDLYLIHGPVGLKEGESPNPTGPDGLEFSEYDYVDTWKAMEEVYKKGLAKAIGISNFNRHQIERILDVASIKPAVNQIECHPYFNQHRLIEFCRTKGIAVTAYSPLGSPGNKDLETKLKVLDDAKLKEIGLRHSKSVAQIALRYQIQRNVVVIPKSTKKKRLEENFNIFDFTLSDEDMRAINLLNKDIRYYAYEETIGHRFYPFLDEY